MLPAQRVYVAGEFVDSAVLKVGQGIPGHGPEKLGRVVQHAELAGCREDARSLPCGVPDAFEARGVGKPYSRDGDE